VHRSFTWGVIVRTVVQSIRRSLSWANRTRPSVGALEAISEQSPKRKLLAPSEWLCAITDVGTSRSTNEDAFYVSPDGRLWLVADGMGGQAAGELASLLTIEAIAESLRADVGFRDVSGDQPDSRLVSALEFAHTRVLRYASQHEECRGMGCAVAAGCVSGNSLHICHSGDVRCYVLSGGLLECVTMDHSVVGRLVRSGLLRSAETQDHPDQGRLEQAVGVPGRFKPAVTTRQLVTSDRVLLCSDGLWEALSDEDIAGVLLSDGSMRQLATVLVDRATVLAGEDNITAVVYEHRVSASCDP